VTVVGEDAEVLADQEMLRAVLLNLLLNACQATGTGPGPVEIETASREAWGEIRILDRGPGIPTAVRDRLFEPFVSARAGGNGLGLAIVRRLTETMGGTIALEDREGGGTVAELRLPLWRP
jgi:signal transduction histidine kinase